MLFPVSTSRLALLSEGCSSLPVSDAFFYNMTIESWQVVVETKVQGTLNVHHALQDVSLDFFVMTSSISSAWGMPDQSNYSAGKSSSLM